MNQFKEDLNRELQSVSFSKEKKQLIATKAKAKLHSQKKRINWQYRFVLATFTIFAIGFGYLLWQQGDFFNSPQIEPLDKNIEAIQAVLEHEFNAPNEEVIHIVNGLSSGAESGPLSGEYYSYLEDTYGPYFTDSGYEKFVATGLALMFHLKADQNNYRINVTKIDVEQNKETPTNYHFTVYINHEKVDGAKMKLEIPGIAILREGKIEKITYLIDGELWRKMKEGE